MSHVLLLGAGFSRNWGGWLASEVLEDLLTRVTDDDELSELLQTAGSFEDALSQVQEEYKSRPSDAATKDRLDRLQEAILNSFGAINQALAAKSMDFSNQMEFSIQRFLSKFDAIFTLNQDLLFELHYNIELHAHDRWNGHHFPGMQPPPNLTNAALADRLNAIWHPMPKFQVEGNLQPIFKLHGSVNWRDAENGKLLVMGADKLTRIREMQILSWYSDQFRRYLEIPNTRLMVIGYSFRDKHINDAISDAYRNNNCLRMFYVDPLGMDVLNDGPQAGMRLFDRLKDIQCIGVSKRPLSTTFKDDQPEHGKLMRFFSS